MSLEVRKDCIDEEKDCSEGGRRAMGAESTD